MGAEEMRKGQTVDNTETSDTTQSSENRSEGNLAAIKEELCKATERADELAGRWQRTQADFINYKRRAEQERSELTKLANLTLIARILPVADDLERAMATLPNDLQQLTWMSGVVLIQRKLEYILQQEGLTPIEALDKDFDPAVHEAVMVEEGVSLHESRVVAEFQRGYKLHDRVLRPALVKVGRRPVETGKE